MAYSFDYLVAPLRCPDGAVSPADESTEMTTRLRDEPALAYLGVGDRLEVDTERARQSGYLVLREPRPGEPIVLLQTWVCPSDGTPFLWARVVIRGGIITEIRETQLDGATIAGAHFIVDDAKWVAAELAGVRTPLDLTDDEAAAVLKAKIP